MLVQVNQGRVWGNGLPFAHDTLRINNFTGEHGAGVHGKLQDVNHLFAAVNFHVGSRGRKIGAALRLLWRSVIEQAPEAAHIARLFNGGVVDIDGAGIERDHFLPFSMRSVRQAQDQETGQQRAKSVLQDWKFGCELMCIHAPYYKVVQ